MVYRNEVMIDMKPFQKLDGLECLFLMLGGHDRVGLMLVCFIVLQYNILQ